MPRTALILGNDSRICLGVVRSLGRAGVHVEIAGNSFDPAVLRSRYLRHAHTLPSYVLAGLRWKNAMVALLGRKHFDLVIPCTELEVIACQRYRHELEQCARVYTLNDQAYDVLFDKFKTTELARSLGVPTPEEFVVTDMTQREAITARFAWPVVLKPVRSYKPDDPGCLHVVQKVRSPAELDCQLSLLLTQGPIAVQENFVGTGVGVELLLNEGKPLLAFQHERIHEPMNGGPSTYRKSQTLTQELLAASLQILKALNYTGVAMVEFKVDKRTGKWVFLEVNARFWGSLPLALAAGADFPRALFELLVEGRTEFNNRYRSNICCRNWTLDLEWQAANLKADRSNPTLESRPLPGVLHEMCVNFLNGRERSDVFAIDDPWPGVVELRQLGANVAARLAGLLPRRKPRGKTTTNHALLPSGCNQVVREV